MQYYYELAAHKASVMNPAESMSLTVEGKSITENPSVEDE